MNISEKAIAEIEQIFYDITTGPETALREQLIDFLDKYQNELWDKLKQETSFDSKNVGEIVHDCNRAGFIMGFIYARTLFG